MAMTAAGMAEKVIAAMDAVDAIQTTDPTAIAAYRLAVMTAMCQGIIGEIVANSELVALTTDTGTEGAGIRTGTVK
jgi:hypothetical protein